MSNKYYKALVEIEDVIDFTDNNRTKVCLKLGTIARGLDTLENVKNLIQIKINKTNNKETKETLLELLNVIKIDY